MAQRKLQRRQQDLTPAERLAERAGLAARALKVCRGNPGLQDLIGLKLLYGAHVSAERAEAAVAGMETYLRQGDLPADAEVRAFLESLALDALLEEAGPSSRALLRAATLFNMPVPESVIGVLAGQVGGSPERLRGLGLLDPYPDVYDPARTALAASPLATGRIGPLSPTEQAALAALTAGPLFAAWGGAKPRPFRELILDVQLARLALAAEDPAITAACAPGAVTSLRDGPATLAFQLGQDAISLLDRHHHPVPLTLLRETAGAALTSGDGSAGQELLDRAIRQAEASNEEGTSPLDRARVITENARHLITRGEPGQAEQALRHAHQLFTAAGAEDEAAAVMGTIADIAYRRGELDEALRIHREVQLPVYERLGDTRETAVTWGSIADIAYDRGEVDEALRIRREITLPVYERLGDTRSAAVTWGQIADIAYRRGEVDEALRIRREVELPVYERLGDTRSAAVTWGQIADIAYQRGEVDEALRIRREITLPVYERLGDTRSAAVTWGRIADIAYRRGEVDEALRIRREVQLPVYERLGDTRSAAVTWGRIADIAYDRGELDEALRIRREVQLPVYEQLGDTRETAVTWGSIADIAYQRGEVDEALRIYREITLPVYERLGDTRSAAVTWGRIADIAYRRGEVDEALRIRREVQLPVYEQLGDTRETAVTWGRIADIAYDRGEVDEALRIRREITLPVYEQLGDTRETAVTWGGIADIAYDRGEVDEALRIRREIELPVYERLGDARSAAVTWGQIADIAYDRGEVDEALRIRREIELPVYERLGDARSAALTWGRIADIAYQRGELDEAAQLRDRQLEASKQLGDLDAVANADWALAQIDLTRQDYQAALPRLIESFQIIGHLQRPDGIAAVGVLLGQLLLAVGQAEEGRQVLEISLAAATKIGWTDAIQQITELLNPPPGANEDT